RPAGVAGILARFTREDLGTVLTQRGRGPLDLPDRLRQQVGGARDLDEAEARVGERNEEPARSRLLVAEEVTERVDRGRRHVKCLRARGTLLLASLGHPSLDEGRELGAVLAAIEHRRPLRGAELARPADELEEPVPVRLRDDLDLDVAVAAPPRAV